MHFSAALSIDWCALRVMVLEMVLLLDLVDNLNDITSPTGLPLKVHSTDGYGEPRDLHIKLASFFTFRVSKQN